MRTVSILLLLVVLACGDDDVAVDASSSADASRDATSPPVDSNSPDAPTGSDSGVRTDSATPTCNSAPIVGAPYPPSPVICALTWDAEVFRDADGGDNWPVTWGDDGALYTAYGDGNGFDSGPRLSLGFSRVTGDPPSFSGMDIRSPSGEQSGDGRSGGKASGMLMLEGTLYMLMRNADGDGSECQLAWSDDRAQSWTFASWNFTQLGYATFINYGQDYDGARDDFVYVVSHDNPSAYATADDFVLLRAPKGMLQTESSWQWFSGLAGGTPQWSSDAAERSSVFRHEGRAARSGISYNAALGRYLWWQQNSEGGVDTRFSGGLGIYDAPEPWGPWTTVYFTDDWDEGPGDAGTFPTKWMSADGRQAWLVHSGDDAFSVRRASFTLAD